MALQAVDVSPLPFARLAPLLGPERAQAFENTAANARRLLDGRTVLNVNSTATGGGVAELLQTLLAYARGAEVDAQWVVIEGNPRFFEITKRLHNHLYGTPGDGGPLGTAEHRDYEQALGLNTSAVLDLVRPGDVVVLHDPQTAGLAAALRRAGAYVVWRCHVGIDSPNEHSERGWTFLEPYVDGADGYVFSCEQFAPSWVSRDHLAVIPPSIDPFSAKNAAISDADAITLLQHVGMLDGGDGEPPHPFTRRDGSQGRVTSRVDLLGTGAPPPFDAPIVVQASRWDALKDMPGVLEGFAEHVVEHTDAHLVLAGPQASGVADDPEATQVLRECVARWQGLPESAQQRIHLACVPMDDSDEAATVVNALQRHATVVVQKSLAEGFGLTVAEAMWKSRPVIASAVGGIVNQIVDRDSGILLPDACDLAQYAHTLRSLLDSEVERTRMGNRARQRIAEHFLADRHLEDWVDLFAGLEPR